MEPQYYKLKGRVICKEEELIRWISYSKCIYGLYTATFWYGKCWIEEGILFFTNYKVMGPVEDWSSLKEIKNEIEKLPAWTETKYFDDDYFDGVFRVRYTDTGEEVQEEEIIPIINRIMSNKKRTKEESVNKKMPNISTAD